MRAITKQGTGGYQLNRSHQNPPQISHDATTRWGSFAHKPEVLQSLLEEQYHLCCYSEIRADEEGLGYHIEHVENRSMNPQRTFDYSNLAASALDSTNDLSTFRGTGTEVFGGHASGKRNAYDVSRFISCHQADCSRFFAYLSDGRVVPASSLNANELDRAQYTIDILNLNSPYLVVRRRQWWNELDTLYEEHSTKGWNLEHLVAITLVPVNNRAYRFFSMSRQFFGSIAERVLQQEASELL